MMFRSGARRKKRASRDSSGRILFQRSSRGAPRSSPPLSRSSSWRWRRRVRYHRTHLVVVLFGRATTSLDVAVMHTVARCCVTTVIRAPHAHCCLSVVSPIRSGVPQRGSSAAVPLHAALSRSAHCENGLPHVDPGAGRWWRLLLDPRTSLLRARVRTLAVLFIVSLLLAVLTPRLLSRLLFLAGAGLRATRRT